MPIVIFPLNESMWEEHNVGPVHFDAVQMEEFFDRCLIRGERKIRGQWQRGGNEHPAGRFNYLVQAPKKSTSEGSLFLFQFEGNIVAYAVCVDKRLADGYSPKGCKGYFAFDSTTRRLKCPVKPSTFHKLWPGLKPGRMQVSLTHRAVNSNINDWLAFLATLP